MFTIQSITAYSDRDFSNEEMEGLIELDVPLEEIYLKAAQVDQYPKDPKLWSPQGLALGVARAPRKSLFLFYLAAHELKTHQFQEAFLHTIQGLMAMENLPELPDTVYPVLRFLFLTFEILCDSSFKKEIGFNLIEGMRKIPAFGLPHPDDKEILSASKTVAALMVEEFEFIPRSAKYLRDKLLAV